MAFLPMNAAEMQVRAWDTCDFIMVCGDAYVDHPSFGSAIISRMLEAEGFRVGMIAQPNWQDDKQFTQLGRPRLAFLVSSGNLDSMLNNYTANKKRRSEDDYAAGGVGGKRPNRAVTVYSQIIRRLYGDVPIILGGIEASLRKMAHYDYWDDKVLPSILADSQADLLIYGMGEKQIKEIAKYAQRGVPLTKLHEIAGSAYLQEVFSPEENTVEVPSYEQVANNKRSYAAAFRLSELEQNPFSGKKLAQKQKTNWLIVNPPAKPLSTAELDAVYDLPYERAWHPSYDALGGVPALQEVEFSITSHRGCFGGCNFCAITSHQGRIIQARSHESILREIRQMTTSKRFKGYIHDIGGPSANFRIPSCQKQLTVGTCSNRQCLFPEPCPNLNADHSDYFALLREARMIPKVKKVFVRSGVRYDYLLADPKGRAYLKELCQYHISGQLKVAPEHVADSVLRTMGKPGVSVFNRFRKMYEEVNRELGRDQFLVPYFMTSHPGCSLQDAVILAEYVRDLGFQPEQVQDFIPTPGSVSTAMYYTGINPMTGEAVSVVKTVEKRKLQRALLQYRRPDNREEVLKALHQAGREDLIGYDKNSLIRPAGNLQLKKTRRSGYKKPNPGVKK
ncbi:MAG: YgiQ family radical SAM protein [Negativicutes bacterium]|nr:YgiQ family radical SAM protein [Negativicutes bacterium]